MRGRRRAVFVLFFVLFAIVVAAQQRDDRQPGFETRERELAALRAEISRLERRLAAARLRQSGARDELAATDVELRLQEVRLAEAMTARDVSARRVAASQGEVERLQEVLERTRRDLRSRLAGILAALHVLRMSDELTSEEQSTLAQVIETARQVDERLRKR